MAFKISAQEFPTIFLDIISNTMTNSILITLHSNTFRKRVRTGHVDSLRGPMGDIDSARLLLAKGNRRVTGWQKDTNSAKG